MVSNDFENRIVSYFKKSKEVPKSTIDAIHNVELEKSGHFVFNIQKVAVIMMTLLTVSTGIVFSKEITGFVKSLFNDSKGVDTAVNNGYVYEVPETIFSESENTKARVKQMLMDDYTLDLSMMIEFNENVNLAGYDKIKFPDLIITDDMDNILYCDNKDVINKYDEEKNIGDISNTSASIFVSSIDANVVHYNCILSASDTIFPKSKKITVKFNTIEIIDSVSNKKHTILGEWENTINVPEEFYNRKTIVYKCINYNNDNVYKDSIKCEITQTGTKFEMMMFWGDYESEKQKSEELRKKNVLDSLLIKEDAYIENEKGDKFYISKSSDSDGGYGISYDNKLKYWQTFDLTKFDLTDKIKITLNTIYNEKIVFELSR